jgi:DnaJ-class molecular chaperone
MHDPLLQDYYNEDYQDKTLTGPFKKDCAFCNGTGVHPGTMKSMDFERCPACEGQGLVEIKADRQDFGTCTQCNGSGVDPKAKPLDYCRVCGGLGIHANN